MRLDLVQSPRAAPDPVLGVGSQQLIMSGTIEKLKRVLISINDHCTDILFVLDGSFPHATTNHNYQTHTHLSNEVDGVGRQFAAALDRSLAVK
jgi:hypothetical protein